MQTYLRDYDWSGVFTEDEVHNWIDSADVRRRFSEGPRVNEDRKYRGEWFDITSPVLKMADLRSSPSSQIDSRRRLVGRINLKQDIAWGFKVERSELRETETA